MSTRYLRILLLLFFVGVVTQSWALAPKSVFAPKRNILEILGIPFDSSWDSHPLSNEEVRSLLVMYGINPEWADQGASFVLINREIKDRWRTMQQDNDNALMNTAIAGRKDEQPKGTYLVDFDPTKPEESDVFKVFHELFHHLFFTDVLGSEGRERFKGFIQNEREDQIGGLYGSYKVSIGSSYISKMYSGRSMFIEQAFKDMRGARHQHDRDIGVSEIFAQLAAAYHIRNIKIKPSEESPTLFASEEIAAHVAQLEDDIPEELKLFFDKIQMADPKWVRQADSRIRNTRSPINRITPSLSDFETSPTAGNFFETSL